MTATLRRSCRRWTVAAAVGLVVAVLGGCGGTTTTGTTNNSNTNGGSTAGNTTGSTSGGTTPVTKNVAMTGFVFSPADITAHAGDSVMWTNQDNTNHTVTADATNTASGGPNSDTTLSNGLTNGQTYMFTVPAGTAVGTKWYYHCRFHGSAGNGSADGAGMSGSITVN